MDKIVGKFLVARDTTENWNAKVNYIPLRGELIIYTDHGTIKDDYGNDIKVPGIKIGDGDAYLIDIPFVGDDLCSQLLHELRNHELNSLIHVTQEDRDFWNSKLNYEVAGSNLILNRN